MSPYSVLQLHKITRCGEMIDRRGSLRQRADDNLRSHLKQASSYQHHHHHLSWTEHGTQIRLQTHHKFLRQHNAKTQPHRSSNPPGPPHLSAQTGRNPLIHHSLLLHP
jgi:hypothetical protein